MLAATIAAGIASGVGRGMHSTEIAADALRIANEIIAQSAYSAIPTRGPEGQSNVPPITYTR